MLMLDYTFAGNPVACIVSSTLTTRSLCHSASLYQKPREQELHMVNVNVMEVFSSVKFFVHENVVRTSFVNGLIRWGKNLPCNAVLLLMYLQK